MKVTGIKTDLVRPGAGSLIEFLDKNMAELGENSVLAITSKIAAICEGRIVPLDKAKKNELAIAESDYYLPAYMSKYAFTFTISHRTLIPSAGIDLSNADGHYVLWPKEPQKTAVQVWHYLKKRFDLKNVGVIMTDSTARPLHYGTEGVGIAYCGFQPKNNYVGKPDLFGRPLEVSVANILDALASAAVLVMGEGTEQTPLAVLEELPFVEFQDHEPSPEELDGFFINHWEDDLFEPFLKNAGWKKGGRN